MNTILIFVPRYLPGYRFGGPVRSVSNMIAHLADRFEFRVFTLDRDLTEDEPYEDVHPNEWNRRENSQVYYCSPDRMRLSTVTEVVERTDHDVLYINGLMNRRFSVYPLFLRRLGRISPPRTILAPRGQLAPGALRLKGWKKYPYLYLARASGLFDGLAWHATSEEEAEKVRSWVGDAPVYRAGNFPNPSSVEQFQGPPKRSGELDLVFLSRIVPKKNLDRALELLEDLPGEVRFSIYGPVGDAAYWKRCRTIMGRLDDNITVDYRGPVEPDEVVSVLARHHLFFLPTRNENHGHVIGEALQAGCPVLISDRTPYKDLEEKGGGWVRGLEDDDAFRGALRRMLKLDSEGFRRLRRGALEVGREARNTDEIARDTIRMLEGREPER